MRSSYTRSALQSKGMKFVNPKTLCWSRGSLLNLLIISGLSMNVNAQMINEPVVTEPDAIFESSEAPERGWKGLARVLDALTPGANTAIPLTPRQVTQRISTLISQGRAEQALEAIEKRLKQREDRAEIGVDVQLLFLQGRALSALERHNEAIEVYRQITTFYPELPEPWNNLGAEYMRQGKTEMAREALEMALTAAPDFTTAQVNLGEVQLLLSQQAFSAAGGAGANRSQQTLKILQQ